MKVFKFGGASVKNADAVRNLGEIVKNYNDGPLIVVVSAMGKTTKKLEAICEAYFNKGENEYANTPKELKESHFNELKKFHWDICTKLFDNPEKELANYLELVKQLEAKLQTESSLIFNYEYDQIVSYGELLSTTIVSTYLNSIGINNQWKDIRKGLRTNNRYREAIVDFDVSEKLIKDIFDASKASLFVTQGFIASTMSSLSTTLGLEGSDYSGALLAFFLEADSLTVWKDVPGVMNADPKWFDNTELIENMDYTDAIELAFYGAGVIHPKTIQPLKRKEIPLYVRSFLDPSEKGTRISFKKSDKKIPSFIFKMDQVLLEICPYDLSFIDEEHLKHLFSAFSTNGLKINFMQNTAVNFKICTNNDVHCIDKIIEALQNNYQINKRKELELITIRYYDEETKKRVLVNKEVLLEHRSSQTIQMVVEPVKTA